MSTSNSYTTLCLVVSALLFSCGENVRGKATKESELEIEPSVAMTTRVSVSTASLRNFEYLIQSNGKIRSFHDQLITSQNGGLLIQCKAKAGSFFTSGSTIAKMETTSIEYRLQKARLAQFNSQKEYESQLLGYETLLKGKTKEEADAIRQKIKISTGLAGAEQEIKEANYELSNTVIRAPFSGVLADVKVQAGEFLRPAQELFRIYEPDKIFLEIKIIEADVSLLKKGTRATIIPLSAPEHRYAAEVFEINPYVDENGQVMIKLKIVNSASKTRALFPGMYCTATIQIAMGKAIVIPKEAIVMRSGKAVVFTLEEGKAKWNDVVLGRDNGKEMEIRSGLKANAKVITTNNLQLVHDSPVQEDSLHVQ